MKIRVFQSAEILRHIHSTAAIKQKRLYFFLPETYFRLCNGLLNAVDGAVRYKQAKYLTIFLQDIRRLSDMLGGNMTVTGFGGMIGFL